MTTPFQPLPCDAGGGGSADQADVEQTLLCDVNAAGVRVGVAILVQAYDETGAAVGVPAPFDPATGLPYVVQGTLVPCNEAAVDVEQEVLCDLQPDNTVVSFIRHYVHNTDDGGLTGETFDTLTDGSVYVPTGTVGSCEPYANCTPTSDQDLNGECGPGESPDQTIIAADTAHPLANAVYVDDASADALCGDAWDRPSSPLVAPFPVDESFRNTTFDQPGPVVQGSPAPFLTAGPPTNDGAGAGWFRVADINSGTNGLWQVPSPFPTSQGINASITFASHDGTVPGGDGMAFVFTDGGLPAQSIPVGGFGNLGLQNWQGGYVAVVLDEYGQTCTCSQAAQGVIDPNPGPCGFCTNTISIQLAGAARQGASCACCTVASLPLAPKALNQTTRSTPATVLVSIIEEGGQTYVSASIDWNDGNGAVQYFDRVNVTACAGPPPATLRMAAYGGSGGSYRAIKEMRDAIARPAGVSNWRSFPITTDAIPACTALVNVEVCVDVTFNADTQTAGNSDPEAYLLLVDTQTGTVLDRAVQSSIPSQVGNPNELCVSEAVTPAKIPFLRFYVGAESRDQAGEYDQLWDNLRITATGTGCPATPRRTLEISARCPIPVTIVGGGGGDGGGGGTTVVNTPSTFEDVPICATVGGVPQAGFRREVRDPSGTVTVTFLGVDGLPITPETWTAGPCPTPIFAGIVCDIVPDTPPQVITQTFAGQTDQGTPGVNSFYPLPNGLDVNVTAPAPVNGSAIDVPENAQINITFPPGSTGHSYTVIHFSPPSQLGNNPNNPTSVSGDATLAGAIVDATVADGTASVFLPTGPNASIQLNDNPTSLQSISYTLAAVPGSVVPIKQFHQIAGDVHTASYTDLEGNPYTVAGELGQCPGTCTDLVLGEVCVSSTSFPGIVLPAVAVQSCTDDTVTYVNPATGTVWPGTVTVVVCPPPNEMREEILCDAGNGGTQFRRVYGLTALGSTVFYDEDLAAGPYVPVGPVGVCDASACTSCQTLTLCDFGADVPVLITGISTGGTLSNGVTWSGARGSAALFNPQHNNADGSWWGMPSFPNSTVAPDTWFFDRPVDVEFSVVIAYSPTTAAGAINSVQVPIGSELISSASDYSYDVATGIVTVDSSNTGDCTKVTNPTVAKSARFLLRNVNQFTLDFLGQRIAICGQFSNWRFGSIAVTPSTTTFLRTICRDCDGAVTTVTDTEADGTTPYTPINPVGDCGSPADAEPQCFGTQICVQPQGVQEFISNEDNLTSTVAAPNVDPVWKWSNDPVAGPWFNMYDVGVFPGWVTVDPGTTQGVANWVAPHPNSSPNTSGLAGEGPTIGPGNANWYARAQFTLPANADPASIRIAATVINADQLGVEFRLNGGAWQPVNASHVDPPFNFPAQVIPGAQAGLNEVFVHVRETVFGSGAAGVKMHLIASYHLGDPQSWTQIVCDDGSVSYFTAAGEQTDALPEDWVIVPCGGSSGGTTTVATRDEELLVLCDATPTRFLRRYNYDAATGNLIGIVNTTLDGSTPFVPVGAVGVCTTAIATDIDFDQIELCDTNGGFLRRFTFNSTTGAVIATTNLTLAGAAYAPVGTVGICDGCCPQVIGNGCTNTGSGFYTAIRTTTGTISLIDSVTGAAVVAANVVACPGDNTVRTLTAQARQVTNAAPWTPGADVVGTLTSLTVTGTGGLWDMVDQSGTALIGLPPGLTLTWTAEDDNTLTGPTSITPQPGSSVVAHWTQR